MRKARKEGKLSEERVEQLDSLGFDWSPERKSSGRKVSKEAEAVCEWDKNHDMIAAGRKSEELEKWLKAQHKLAILCSPKLGHIRRDKINHLVALKAANMSV